MSRSAFAGLAVGTIAAGLLVHWRGGPLGATTRDVVGDALWASMIYWWVGALAPRAGWAVRAATAFAICAAVELSQLSTAPLLRSARGTRLGHLVLGSDYDPRDLLAYAVGVAAAAGAERLLARRRGVRRSM